MPRSQIYNTADHVTLSSALDFSVKDLRPDLNPVHIRAVKPPPPSMELLKKPKKRLKNIRLPIPVLNEATLE